MGRSVSPLAGLRPQASALVTRDQMRRQYYYPQGSLDAIKNGTSGHRGLTGNGFSDRHVAAMTQALIDIRRQRGTFGPDLANDVFQRLTANQQENTIVLGKDVRFSSDFAQRTAAEIFAANGFKVVIHKGDRATPTPVISHYILSANSEGRGVEGGIITASHNPPEEAGYKSNGLNGGPNTRTKPIDDLANQLMKDPSKIKRMDYDEAVRRGLIIETDLITPYVTDLPNVVRLDAIRGGRFAATPLGGSANGYYEAVNALHGTNIQVVLGEPDPASANRTYDWDSKLRGDPSSKYVMRAVAGYLGKLNVPFIGANDNDADRFGGEDRTEGILDPNHVLCVLFDYLAKDRGFNPDMGIGRTIGTTHMLDLIAADYGRPAYEVNVGFKYYVDGLINGKYVLAGEESAGMSFPRLNGLPWVTEKDGIATVLLMMEIMAKTGKDIGTLYGELVAKYGPHQYERIDATATAEKKARLAQLAANPDLVKELLSGKKPAGRTIERMIIGDGVKVVLEGGVWVLKRASGTENVIKDYREERGESLETAAQASQELDEIFGLA